MASAQASIERLDRLGAGGGRRVGVDQDLVGPGQAPPSGEGQDLEPAEVERLGRSRPAPVAVGIAEQVVDERDGVAEVGDDGVGADAEQPPALPLVDPAGAVVGLGQQY